RRSVRAHAARRGQRARADGRARRRHRHRAASGRGRGRRVAHAPPREAVRVVKDALIGLAAWTRPEVTHVGRLPMRSPLLGAPDVETARDATARNPWVRSLDGRWRFRLVDAPERAPKGFMRPHHRDRGWAEVDVPGLWTMQGFDRPIYTNVQMPFRGVPPQVPDHNPTGLSRRRFTIPKRWKGRRIVLHVGAADSVLHVWVNGAPVGISKDS